jgi:hypothetical protein
MEPELRRTDCGGDLPPAVTSRDADTEAHSGERDRPGKQVWGGDHFVNIRLSIPLIFVRFYVTIVAGKERRGAPRRAEERRKHPLARLGNMMVLGSSGTVIGIALFTVALVAFLVTLNQVLGIKLTLHLPR